jgi:hypothetical protein
MRSRTLKWLFVMALMASSAFIPHNASSTAFAASCSGTGCDGKDPDATQCSVGATTLDSRYVSYGGRAIYVELRWSPTCQTNWTRVTNQTHETLYMGARMQQQNVTGSFYNTYKSGGYGYQF